MALNSVDEPLMRRNEPPGLSRLPASIVGRVATYERYAGLRAQLLNERLQQHAAMIYHALCDQLNSNNESEHHE